MKALIFGITGQDGQLLNKFLLEKGYNIVGTTRSLNNIDSVYLSSNIKLVEVDYSYFSVKSLIQRELPDEIYNLSGLTSVSLSNSNPYEAYNSIFNTTLFILESIRLINKKIKFFNPSSSECFGNIDQGDAVESTGFNPLSPYASAKCSAHLLAKSYKSNYNIFVCTAILSNHESHLRAASFVTTKIIKSAINISKGIQTNLEIGNLSIIRDWGWAEDYIEAIYLMMKSDIPDDYIIATGKAISLEDFISYTFNKFNLDYKNYIKINTNLQRTNDIKRTSLNNSKIKNKLGWNPKKNVFDVIDNLIDYYMLKEIKIKL